MTGSLGFLFASVPFSAVIDFLGWRGTFLLSGIILSVCGMFLYIILIKKQQQALFVKKESEREKLSVIFRRIFTTRQAWMLFFATLGLLAGSLDLLVLGQCPMR